MTDGNQTLPWLQRLCEFIQGYQLTKAKESAERLAAERQTQIESLTKARYEQTELAEKRQARIDELTKASATAAEGKSETERQKPGAKRRSHGTPTGP